VRAVTHLDVDEVDTARAGEILVEVAERAPGEKTTAKKGVTYA
jgi:hypothetical protein